MALEKFLAAARNLASLDLVAVSLGAVRDNEQRLIDANQTQLQQSIDSDGDWLGEYRSIAYANLKGRPDVDLKLTGDFYRGMFVDANKYPVVFSSRDEKTEMLTAKYGDEIFGTTKENQNKINHEAIKPAIQAAITETLRV